MYLLEINSLIKIYGGLPITISNPPDFIISGNSLFQSKALSLTVLSEIKEFPHFILLSNNANGSFLLADFSHKPSFVISTLSEFKSTPKMLLFTISFLIKDSDCCNFVGAELKSPFAFWISISWVYNFSITSNTILLSLSK